MKDFYFDKLDSLDANIDQELVNPLWNKPS